MKPHAIPFWQSALLTVAIVGLFSIMAARMIESARVSSATTDEAIHILSGYLAIKDGDYRLNPEHPFLGKMIAATPHLFLQTPLPNLAQYQAVASNFAYDSWSESRNVANSWLYLSGLTPQQVLWPSRLTLIVVTILAGFGLSGWAFYRYGPIGALVTAGFYSLDPTIIAHGQLANTDIWALVGFVSTLLVFIAYAERPTWKRLVVLALVLGIALNLKFSLLLLVPILAFLWVIVRWRFAKPIAPYWVGALALGLGWVVVTALVYSRDLTTIAQAMSTAPSMTLSTPWMNELFRRPPISWLLPAEFWKGVEMVWTNATTDRSAYLLGEVGKSWWYYFPVAFLVKESLVLVIGFLALIVVGPVRIRQWSMVGTILAIGLAVYWGVVMKSSLMLGIRHMLPVVAPTILLLAGAISAWWITATRRGKWLVSLGLMAAGVFTSLSLNQVHPFYIPYFNELIGGQANGGRYLADSNIDWGQSLPQLHDWLVEHGVSEPILLEYQWTGSAAPGFYGIAYEVLTAENQQSARLIAVSRSGLAADWGYIFLRSKTPTALVGNSIAIFDQR